jgi:hypothetical protein
MPLGRITAAASSLIKASLQVEKGVANHGKLGMYWFRSSRRPHGAAHD